MGIALTMNGAQQNELLAWLQACPTRASVHVNVLDSGKKVRRSLIALGCRITVRCPMPTA